MGANAIIGIRFESTCVNETQSVDTVLYGTAMQITR